jgi:hypothetical protein
MKSSGNLICTTSDASCFITMIYGYMVKSYNKQISINPCKKIFLGDYCLNIDWIRICKNQSKNLDKALIFLA